MNVFWAIASVNGRMRRRDYVIASVLILILSWLMSLALSRLAECLFSDPKAGSYLAPNSLKFLISLLVWIVLLWPRTAVGVKRLHDQGLSGWWLLLDYLASLVFRIAMFRQVTQHPDILLPTGMALYAGIAYGLIFICFVILLVFLDGTPGPNKYGDSPKPDE